MQERTKEILNGLTERYPALKVAKNDISAAFEALLASVKSGGKIMICGNGGSAADSAHIVGELMKSFKKTRPIDAKTAARLKEYGKEGAQRRVCRVCAAGVRAGRATRCACVHFHLGKFGKLRIGGGCRKINGNKNGCVDGRGRRKTRVACRRVRKSTGNGNV